MDKWTILGIEKTKDKTAIKNAYREQLVSVNPEDNPEGFKALRQAYEDAMYEADKEDVKEDSFEEGSLQYELNSLYDDFFRRIKIDEWQKLFDRDEFIAIDKVSDTRDEVLAFFMKKHS